MSDEIDINSVERFSKQSKKLILEELNRCEVPAGCGGVVLRWLSLEHGLSVGFRIRHFDAESQVYCNGQYLPNCCTNLPFSPGVLAIHIEKRVDDFDWFSVVANHTSYTREAQHGETIPELSLSDDGTWKFTTEPPTENWTEIEFNDSSWETMEEAKSNFDSVPENREWLFRRLNEDNTPRLSIPRAEVWIRKHFDLTTYLPE